MIVRELGLSPTAVIKLFLTFTPKACPGLTLRLKPFAVLEIHSKTDMYIYMCIHLYTCQFISYRGSYTYTYIYIYICIWQPKTKLGF